MKKIKFLLFALMLLMAAPVANAQSKFTVPVTGRKVRLWVSDEQVLSLSEKEYKSYLTSTKLSTNATQTAMVKRVGSRLATAVETYLKQTNRMDAIQNYSWEFNLVQDNSANAFCMPGGKIVVYEGLLPVTQDETSLAIVLGHEIAHAVAKHSAEQMSTLIRQQYGAQALSVLMQGAGASSGLQNIAGTVFGLGAKGASAKYSRNHESEADHLGIIFAAMAGYDPQKAVDFWKRMSQATGGGSKSWLSTHPTDATRIAQIQAWMPEAMKYYKPQAVVSTNKKNTVQTQKKNTTTQKKKSITKKARRK